uniref:Exportin-1 C-terminal domain-containing protein n=1 Tax=Vitis vinifera TaxID=29760 RepID=A5B138_VITVI|nr:hypothetical protein VITISV_006632 [Vitis vinifera]
MLNVCRMYSELISNSIAEGRPFASKTSYIKLLPSVKGETHKLTEIFLDKAEDRSQIGKQLVSPMMDPVLGDYSTLLMRMQTGEEFGLDIANRMAMQLEVGEKRMAFAVGLKFYSSYCLSLILPSFPEWCLLLYTIPWSIKSIQHHLDTLKQSKRKGRVIGLFLGLLAQHTLTDIRLFEWL